MLDCFEGLECEMLKWEGIYPKVRTESSEQIAVYRYSSTQDQKMPLRGIRGGMQLEKIPEDLILLQKSAPFRVLFFILPTYV